MKSIIYARVSTNKQETQRQINDLKQYAASKNCEIVKIFEEKISALEEREKRKPFAEILEFCEKNQIEFVFCSELSRIGRKVVDVSIFLEALEKLDIGLIIQNPPIETGRGKNKNPIAQFFFSIAAAFAQMERNYILDRTRSGRQQAIENGKKMGRKTGSVLTEKELEEKYKIEISKIKAGYKLADIQKITGTSLRTLSRLKKYLEKKSF